jgi:WD40 repeat protein
MLLIAILSITESLSARVARPGAAKTMFLRKMKTATMLLIVVATESSVGTLGGRVLAQPQQAVAPSAGTVQTKPTSAQFQKSTQPRLDLYGDPLPAGAIARLGTVRLYHPGPARLWKSPVSGLVYSPDGKTVFGGGMTETIRGWNVDSGKEVRQFVIPHEEMPGEHWFVATPFALSPDGKTLAAPTFHRPMAPGTVGFHPVGFPPDQQGPICLWDVASGRLLHRCQGQPVGSLAFSHDGKVLASGGGNPGEVRYWEVATGKELRRLELEGPGVYVGGILPGSDALAVVGRDSTIFILDAAGKVRHQLKGHVTGNICVAFSRDGKTLASIEAGRPERDPEFYVRIWSVEDGKLHQRLGHESRVQAVAFGADGMLAALAADGIHFWDSHSGKELRHTDGPPASSTANSSLAFSPDGRTVAYGSGDGVITFWDVATAKQVRRMPRHYECLNAVAVSPDGRTAATASNDHSISLWDVASSREIRSLTGHKDRVQFVAFAPNGKLLASASFDDGDAARVDSVFVLLWDVATGEIVQRYQAHCVAFSPDGKQVACGGFDDKRPGGFGPGIIRLYDARTGKLVRRFQGHKTRVDNIAFSPDGKTLASISLDLNRFAVLFADLGPKEDFMLRLWYEASGRERPPMNGSSFNPSILTFSPDARLLVTVNRASDQMQIWEVATGKQRRLLDLKTLGSVASVLVMPDGRTLALGTSRGELAFLDLAAGMDPGRVRGHSGAVNGLALSPDGKTLFSASSDTTALVWDVSSVLTPPQSSSTPLSDSAVEALWVELANADAARADQAIWTLVAAGAQAITYIDARLKPTRESPFKRMPQLLADLDSNEFATREAASEELWKLLPEGEERLRATLGANPSAEVRRRLADLLERSRNKIPAPEVLRGIRALEVLEHFSTPAACNLLKKLAAGAPQARLTQEAKAAVERLQR